MYRVHHIAAEVVTVPWTQSLKLRIGLAISIGILITSTATSALMVHRAIERADQEIALEMRSSGHVLASSLSNVVAEKNTAQIERVLRSVSYSDRIKSVEITDIDGLRIGSMGMEAVLNSELDKRENSTTAVSVDVKHAGYTVGQIRLLAAHEGRADDLTSDLLEVLLWSLLTALFGGGLTFMWQGRILRPIENLAAKMAQPLSSTPQAANLPVTGKGEIGVLFRAYDQMVTEIAKRDQAILNHNQQLEREVAERTKDAEEARKEAERANDAKSQFLATMSHEIRTPMNGILVLSEVLAKANLPSTEKRYAEIIKRSGGGLLNILNDILDLSKTESGRLELENIPFSIDDLVENEMMLFWQRAREANILLVSNVASDVPAQMMGDPVRLQQCLSNLIGNALKFTSSGSIGIGVEWVASAETPNDGTLSISVKDTGVGISPNKLADIFDPFIQADSSTTRTYGGTGLGLSITKKLVEAMGGEIGVDSELGFGSRFEIQLPTHARSDSKAPYIERQLRIAVEIDDEAVRRSLEKSLSETGIELLDAAEGSERADCFIVPCIETPTNQTNNVPKIGLWFLDDDEPREEIASGRLADVLRYPYTRDSLNELLVKVNNGTLLGKATFEAPNEPLSSEAGKYVSTRILVADDQAANCETLQAALDIYGMAAETVSNGREAVKACRNAHYDMIFLDGNMPEMDGFEAAKIIRSEFPSSTLILFSATVVQNADAIKTFGFDDFLPKPFGLDQLEQLLDSHCERDDSPIVNEATTRSESNGADAFEGLSETVIRNMRTLEGKRPGAVSRIYTRCIEALPNAIDQIQQAWASGDAEQLRQAGHSLKSLSTTAGSIALADVSAEIETAASNALAEGAKVPLDHEKLEDLKIITAETAQLLEKFVDSFGSEALSDKTTSF